MDKTFCVHYRDYCEQTRRKDGYTALELYEQHADSGGGWNAGARELVAVSRQERLAERRSAGGGLAQLQVPSSRCMNRLKASKGV